MRNPHSPDNALWSMDRNGVSAPPGFAFNIAGQLVQLNFLPWQSGQNALPPGMPAMPWESFDNPAYVAAMTGRSTIEMQPRVDPTAPPGYGMDPMGRAVPPLDARNASLVPAELYMRQEDSDVPTQDVGTLALTGVGERGAPARTSYRLSKNLISYVAVPSPDESFALAILDPSQPSPLNVPPVQAVADAPPIGGCVSIAQIAFGHLGNQFNALYDVPPAQIIHVPFGGSFGSTDTMLVPKYFTPAVDPATNFRVYLVTPTGPLLTTAIWNTLRQDVLPANGFVNPNKVPFQGWFALAQSFSNTVLSQPVRRFYGSVLGAAPVPNPFVTPIATPSTVTRCPVAWYASQVTLVAPAALNFIVEGLTSAGGVTQTWGPFPANQAIQLPANAQSILVFATVTPIHPGVPRFEQSFELDFTLSF